MKPPSRPTQEGPGEGIVQLRRIRRGVERTFGRLESWTCLKAVDLRDFRAYHRGILEALEGIEVKVAAGSLNLLDLDGFPGVASFPHYHLRAGLFLGSFDPFQMTHLTMALKFLADPQEEVDVVFVVPEGAPSHTKADRSDYTFRYEVLRAQVADVFRPLVVPLDLGRDADTMEIVRRLIALFPGSTMALTHLLGTDSLPLVQKHLDLDREVWGDQTKRSHVTLDYRIHAFPRGAGPTRGVAALRARGVPVTVGPSRVPTPSSTDLRRRAVFTILFPAAAVLKRVEILFRYSMNVPWTEDDPAGPSQGPAG